MHAHTPAHTHTHQHRHLSRVSHARTGCFTPGSHCLVGGGNRNQAHARLGAQYHQRRTTAGELGHEIPERALSSLFGRLSQHGVPALQRLRRARRAYAPRQARKSLTGVPQAGVTEQKHLLSPLVSFPSAALSGSGAALNARPAGCGSERAVCAGSSRLTRLLAPTREKGPSFPEEARRRLHVLAGRREDSVRPYLHPSPSATWKAMRRRQRAAGLLCCFPMVGQS